MTTSTLSGRIARVEAGGQDALVVRLILGVLEDPPFHPVGPFTVSAMAILAPGRLEIAQMLEHQDVRLLCLCKLDNAGAHQVRNLLIYRADLAPEVGIVLFILGNDASLGSVACNPSQLSLPKAGYLLAPPDEAGG